MKNKLGFWTFLGLILWMAGCASVPGDKTPQIVATLKGGFEVAVSQSLILAKHYKPELVNPIVLNLEYTESELTIVMNSGKVDAPTVTKIVTDTFNQINSQVSVLPFDIAFSVGLALNSAASLVNVYLASETIPANAMAYVGAIQSGIGAGIADFQTNPMLHKPTGDKAK